MVVAILTPLARDWLHCDSLPPNGQSNYVNFQLCQFSLCLFPNKSITTLSISQFVYFINIDKMGIVVVGS